MDTDAERRATAEAQVRALLAKAREPDRWLAALLSEVETEMAGAGVPPERRAELGAMAEAVAAIQAARAPRH